ncbi:MAG TPA: GTPase, partial [Pyrinomonadaceae bacterium]|nr:GTPase [Pyrinomonadaceae bacterium]
RLRLPYEQDVILNDTVGFIRDLPPDLIAAFRATLEEIADSDLLVHLIDASNPRWEQQIESVDKILSDLDFGDIPRLVVFNKADLVEPETLDALLRQACAASSRQCIAVSATDARSLRPMLEMAGAILARDLTHDQHTSAAHAAEEHAEHAKHVAQNSK